MDNLEEMEKLLGKYNPPKLNQEKYNILTEIEAVIKIFSNNKPQNQMASQVNPTINSEKS